MKRKVMLIIMDGLGLGKDYPGNAVKLANKENLDALMAKYPTSSLKASGIDVGLPAGQMGNSEVGHLNIGSGRIVYQDLSLINKEIEDGDFFKNESLINAVENAKNDGKALHLLGLVSKGGVHSHLNHVYAILELAKQRGLDKVFVHAFLDGRDVSPTAGIKDIEELLNKMKEIGVGKLATITGRYYAMDRDNRWERVERAYKAIVNGEGKQVSEPLKSIEEEYAQGTTDEFMTPSVVLEGGNPVGKLTDGDSVIFFNYRPDRARELTRAIVDNTFEGFDRGNKLTTYYVTMTEYDKTIENVDIAYAPKQIKNTLGEIVSKNGLTQLRTAETEKYAHVTFFFNGGVEQPYEGEERILVPSPKVATYDLKPEMSAFEVKDKVIARMKDENGPDMIILNFANPDMVGHTGVIEAAVKAVETVDQCVGQISEVGLEHGYDLLLTADHGNSEQLIDYDTNKPFTAHTTNIVPLIYVTNDKDVELLDDGKLSDLAPTMLDILNIEKPEEMTGHSLIKRGK